MKNFRTIKGVAPLTITVDSKDATLCHQACKGLEGQHPFFFSCKYFSQGVSA